MTKHPRHVLFPVVFACIAPILVACDSTVAVDVAPAESPQIEFYTGNDAIPELERSLRRTLEYLAILEGPQGLSLAAEKGMTLTEAVANANDGIRFYENALAGLSEATAIGALEREVRRARDDLERLEGIQGAGLAASWNMTLDEATAKVKKRIEAYDALVGRSATNAGLESQADFGCEGSADFNYDTTVEVYEDPADDTFMAIFRGWQVAMGYARQTMWTVVSVWGNGEILDEGSSGSTSGDYCAPMLESTMVIMVGTYSDLFGEGGLPLVCFNATTEHYSQTDAEELSAVSEVLLYHCDSGPGGGGGLVPS